MNTILTIIHLLVSAGLIGLILLQSGQGGLGTTFGAAEGYRTKRGAERAVFIGTIVLGILFLTTSIATFVVR